MMAGRKTLTIAPADRVLAGLLRQDSANAWNIIQRQELLNHGITPLEIMLAAAREHWDECEYYKGQSRAAAALDDIPAAAEYQVLARQAMDRAVAYATQAAPYLHPRLSAIRAQTTTEQALTVQMIDYSRVEPSAGDPAS